MHISDLRKKLQAKYPIILIDQIIEFPEDNRLAAIKNVTLNESFFQNSNLEEIFLPEGFILEAIAQTSQILISKKINNPATSIFFDSVKSIKFHKRVFPGEQLRIEVEINKITEKLVTVNTTTLKNGQLVSEGIITFKLTEEPSRPQIHPTAEVHSSALIGKDVIIGPYCVIGENVIIGARTILDAHTMVEKWTQIGEDCHIHFGSVIGSGPQDKKYQGEKGFVKIGNRTIIREYGTINRPTGENEVTQIGDDCLILTNVHVGHNCKIGNGVVITNLTHVAGHIEIEDKAIIGGMVGMHQNVRIGKGSMVGGYSKILQDVPPFMLCEGTPAIIRATNSIGLKRSGASMTAIKEMKQIHKIFFRSNLNTSQAIEEIDKAGITTSAEAKYFMNFIKTKSKRGLTKLGDTPDQEKPEE